MEKEVTLLRSIDELIIDPELRDLLPPLSQDEYAELEKSILQNGLFDTIKVWEDESTEKTYLVDGHNRYSICKKNSIPIEYWHIQRLSGYTFETRESVIKYMLDNQLGRRNLTPAQRYAIAAKYRHVFEAQAKKNMSAGGKGLTNLSKVNTRAEMSKAVGVSEGSISKLDKIYKSGDADIKQKVLDDKMSIDAAYKKITGKSTKQAGNSFSNTDECDRAIKDLEQKEKQLQEERAQLYLRRQKIFEESPEDDLHCEVVEVGNVNFWGYDFDHKYVFYLVKNGNRKEILELSDGAIRTAESIYEWVDLKMKSLNRNSQPITAHEKAILLSKIFETQEQFLENEKTFSANQEKFFEYTAQNCIKSKTIRCAPDIKEIITDIVNAGYKALAKKYHPDVSNDSGQQMQKINEAKNVLDSLIS